jgi:hypothetical protein
MRTIMMSVMVSALLSIAALADEPSVVAAAAQPDGTVTLSGGSVAVGVGYVWGHGDLSYRNASHRFSISGLSIVDVGAANISATGHVYNLKRLQDFAGNYVAATAGLTVGGGGTAAYLKNEHGVVMKLEATTVGLRFNLSADGVRVKLEK